MSLLLILDWVNTVFTVLLTLCAFFAYLLRFIPSVDFVVKDLAKVREIYLYPKATIKSFIITEIKSDMTLYSSTKLMDRSNITKHIHLTDKLLDFKPVTVPSSHQKELDPNPIMLYVEREQKGDITFYFKLKVIPFYWKQTIEII